MLLDAFMCSFFSFIELGIWNIAIRSNCVECLSGFELYLKRFLDCMFVGSLVCIWKSVKSQLGADNQPFPHHNLIY